MAGAFGSNTQQPRFDVQELQTIRDALNATLDPRVSSPIRQQALRHLESVKALPYAPHYGFQLADDWNEPAAVRHYGLQLLEYTVKYRWSEYSSGQAEQFRIWVKQLAGSVRAEEAFFVRNKIAQLWVEIAKRSWGQEWMDMDRLLVNMWDASIDEKGTANKLLVLYILEMLSDDICNKEDAAAGLHLDVLGPALNEIMIPDGMYMAHLALRGTSQEVRASGDGWLARICTFLSTCAKAAHIASDPAASKFMCACAIKALAVLRATVPWISLKAIKAVNCMDCLYLPFHLQDLALQTAAAEVLFALISRPSHHHFPDIWSELICQFIQSDRIRLIGQPYQRALSTEDDELHTLQKKLSEVLSAVADGVAAHPSVIKNNVDVPVFFELLVQVLQSKSLVVSIPVLHSWTRLLCVQASWVTDLISSVLGILLQTTSARLLRYDALPEETFDEITQFLYDDFDTLPERHAFLGNYRRYCATVIERIARSRPLDALELTLTETTSMLQNGPYTTEKGFSASTWTRNSPAVLQFDAQYAVVLSALKGFARWSKDVDGTRKDSEHYTQAQREKANAKEALQQWTFNVTGISVHDPEVAAQLLQMLVAILRASTGPTGSLVLRVVQYLLTMRLYDDPTNTTLSNSVKTFEILRVNELQKLGINFPDELFEVYQELEPRVRVLAETYNEDQRLVWGYRAFLFVIIHRAGGIDDVIRMRQLQEGLEPVHAAWQDANFRQTTDSYASFCDSLGISQLPDFWRAHRFAEVQDWSAQELDFDGQALQAQIRLVADQLPLRMTKSMLAATVEKLAPDGDPYAIACELWSDITPVVLPPLLQMVKHAQAFHNPVNWSQLPDDLQMVVRHTLQDRFWQSGISNESKDEFYARISGTKTSYEGFASTVRGTMRNVREQGYNLIYLMASFEEQFYGMPDLPNALSETLFKDAEHLSANHLHPVINLVTGLVQRCPPHYRMTFLPPLIIGLFQKLDAKITREWQRMDLNVQKKAEDDELGDEMRAESILRQLTYSMVSFVPTLLEHDKQSSSANGQAQPAKWGLADMVLANVEILEPLMLFCTHALGMRDSRCCALICKVFRSIIPRFTDVADPGPEVRGFISQEVLKACIVSLNEPYFAEMQRDLASVIAQIIFLYAPMTVKPREVLLSVPNMPPGKVHEYIARICQHSREMIQRKSPNLERHQRSLVMELLEGVRGVSIHEQGKMEKSKVVRKDRSAMQQQYMEVEQRPVVGVGNEVGLEDVSGLFGDV